MKKPSREPIAPTENESDDEGEAEPTTKKQKVSSKSPGKPTGRYVLKKPACFATKTDAVDGGAEQQVYDDKYIQTTSRGQEMRDPVKAKRFFQMLHEGTLPDNLKATYEGASKEKGGGAFQNITKVINRGVKRTGPGTLVVQENHPYLTHLKQHVKTGYQKEYHAGMIFEEAKSACGSFEDLKNATYAGRITTSGDGAWEDLTYWNDRL